jgi:hypothetical protein
MQNRQVKMARAVMVDAHTTGRLTLTRKLGWAISQGVIQMGRLIVKMMA